MHSAFPFKDSRGGDSGASSLFILRLLMYRFLILKRTWNITLPMFVRMLFSLGMAKIPSLTLSYSIYKLHGDKLMSDIPDYIFELLGNETDLSTRRNAFAFLMECKQPLAVEFLEANCDEVLMVLRSDF